MRLLWLTKLNPASAGIGGDLLYTMGMIRGCLALGAEVWSIAYGDRSEIIADASQPRWIQVSLPNHPLPLQLLSRLPTAAARYVSREYREALRGLLDQMWDGIILDSIAMAWLLDVLQMRKPDTPVVYLAHNHETTWRQQYVSMTKGIRRTFLRLDSFKASRLEKRVCQNVNIISAITPEDARSFSSDHPEKATIVAPPGYDFTGPLANAASYGLRREVSILGSFHWSAKQLNLLNFMERAGQAILEQGVHLKVIGDAPGTFKRHLCALYPGIQVTGRVESFSDHLSTSRIGLIIDEIGGGFKLKALDYAMNGIPIIALKGAMQGMPLVAGEDYLCAASMEQVADEIIRVIDDRNRLEGMRSRAYAKCHEEFRWDRSARKLLIALVEARTQD